MSVPIAVLVSGRGSNLRALMEAEDKGQLGCSIRCVISSNSEAAALNHANVAGIETCVCAKPDPDAQLLEILEQQEIALVCMAGYMRILSPAITTPYAGRILNIHPSLLPRYPGLHTHRRVLEAGDAEHGCTVHFATAELDGGPRIIQATVPVLSDDDEDTLAARVLEQEHQIYPQAVQWFCQGELRLDGDTVWLHDQQLEGPIAHAVA